MHPHIDSLSFSKLHCNYINCNCKSACRDRQIFSKKTARCIAEHAIIDSENRYRKPTPLLCAYRSQHKHPNTHTHINSTLISPIRMSIKRAALKHMVFSKISENCTAIIVRMCMMRCVFRSRSIEYSHRLSTNHVYPTSPHPRQSEILLHHLTQILYIRTAQPSAPCGSGGWVSPIVALSPHNNKSHSSHRSIERAFAADQSSSSSLAAAAVTVGTWKIGVVQVQS